MTPSQSPEIDYPASRPMLLHSQTFGTRFFLVSITSDTGILVKRQARIAQKNKNGYRRGAEAPVSDPVLLRRSNGRC